MKKAKKTTIKKNLAVHIVEYIRKKGEPVSANEISSIFGYTHIGQLYAATFGCNTTQAKHFIRVGKGLYDIIENRHKYDLNKPIKKAEQIVDYISKKGEPVLLSELVKAFGVSREYMSQLTVGSKKNIAHRLIRVGNGLYDLIENANKHDMDKPLHKSAQVVDYIRKIGEPVLASEISSIFGVDRNFMGKHSAGSFSRLNKHFIRVGVNLYDLIENQHKYEKEDQMSANKNEALPTSGITAMPTSIHGIEELNPEPPTFDVNRFITAFTALPNAKKAELISIMVPVFTVDELQAKFEELYPNHILKDVVAGDTLFHPLVGEINIVKASKDRLGFYGNGKEWSCDRNGYVVIDGKPTGNRVLFCDLNEYANYMQNIINEKKA
jgi:hypothetical protein